MADIVCHGPPNFNDFLLSAKLIRQLHPRSVIITSTELPNILLGPLAECRPDDATLTSM